MGLGLDPDFKIPVFRNVTHLELVNHEAPLPESSGLHHLPLTHLAFIDWDEGALFTTVNFMLSSCETLRVLVVTSKHTKFDLESISDIRFVIATKYYDPISDWGGTSTGNSSMWGDAERIVATRSKSRPGANVEGWGYAQQPCSHCGSPTNLDCSCLFHL